MSEGLKEKLESYIQVEMRIAELSEKSVAKVKNMVIKELIESIALDSRKHAGMLRALVALLEHKAPFMSEDEAREVAAAIREHIKIEEEAIEHYTKLAEQAESKPLKTILSYIAEDEKRHHMLLKAISEMAAKRETLTEQMIWDLLWKYTLWHGAPGG